MLVSQIYELVNNVIKETTGEQTTLLTEDLSNVVAVGEEVFKATDVDNFTKTLVDHIGKMVFVARTYKGLMPKVLTDSWEFGSVLQKVRAEMPEASENEAWELQDGASYDGKIFHAPNVSAKYYNLKATLECDISITDDQAKSAFSSAQQMNSFVDMIFVQVENRMTLQIEQCARRVINSMIADTIYSDYQGQSLSDSSGVKAINLLKLYNDATGDNTVTASNALVSKEFLRFASKVMRQTANRMKAMTQLYNIGGTKKFTPMEYLHIILHADFDASAHAYLYSDTFHKDEVKLPDADIVPFWQGTGASFDFADTGDVKVVSASGNSVEVTGIVGVMYDHDACMVMNPIRKTITERVPKAEFTNYYFKWETSLYEDKNEQFVVFFIA